MCNNKKYLYKYILSEKCLEDIKIKTKEKIGIYMIENNINKKKWIGIVKSSGKDKSGFYRNIRKLFKTTAPRFFNLKNDIKKYGVLNFTIYILKFSNTHEDIKEYISYYKPEYNIEKKFKKSNLINEIPFNKPKTKSYNRIGPHSEEIISIIFGTLLGDSYAERQEYLTSNGKKKGGTRIIFQQEDKNVEYLMKFWSILAERGYCSDKKPKLLKRISEKDTIRWYYKLNTWTYNSLNWVHDMWYDEKKIKIIPKEIEKYLTPMALAYWVMDDGTKVGKGIKLCTNSYTYEEVNFLCNILLKKYNLKSTPNKTGVKNQYVIYIHKESIERLKEIIKKHMVESMLNKLP